MLFVRGCEDGNGDPPLADRYHCMFCPEAIRFMTVGLSPEQNDCGEFPLGGIVSIMFIEAEQQFIPIVSALTVYRPSSVTVIVGPITIPPPGVVQVNIGLLQDGATAISIMFGTKQESPVVDVILHCPKSGDCPMQQKIKTSKVIGVFISISELKVK